MATDVVSPKALAALQAGNKIEAIKIIRQLTGAGLVEAKAMVEHLQSTLPALKLAPGQSGLHPAPAKATRASAYLGPHLAPGEVPRLVGGGAWVTLILAVAAEIVFLLFVH